MRNRIERIVQAVLALVLLWGGGYLIWTILRQLLTRPALAACPIGVLACGLLVAICWPQQRKKALAYLLLAVGWAAADIAHWLHHSNSMAATLRGILVMIGLWLSWLKWKTGKESRSHA
jgi:hypothetical protein